MAVIENKQPGDHSALTNSEALRKQTFLLAGAERVSETSTERLWAALEPQQAGPELSELPALNRRKPQQAPQSGLGVPWKLQVTVDRALGPSEQHEGWIAQEPGGTCSSALLDSRLC